MIVFEHFDTGGGGGGGGGKHSVKQINSISYMLNSQNRVFNPYF